jgi:hypothetical protein
MIGVRTVDLTGVWLGLYSYPHDCEPVSFVATLIETAGAISGSSHEAQPRPFFPAYTALATLFGRRGNGAIVFVKTYDEGRPHAHPIYYDGVITDEGGEIEGRWSIPRMWSGRFVMIRSAPNAEIIARKIYERSPI